MKKVSLAAIPSRVRVGIFGIVLAAAMFGAVFMFTKSSAQGTITTAKCDAGVTCVYLKPNRAEPDVITVPVGGYAQINSADGQTHDIASGNGEALHAGGHVHTEGAESGNFKADEAWKVQFNTAGTFDFHDHYHSNIHFTVIVYQPGGDYKIKP